MRSTFARSEHRIVVVADQLREHDTDTSGGRTHRPGEGAPEDRGVEEDSEEAARFRAAFERHYEAVLGYALRRTASPEDAEEVTASTFTIAWRRIDRLPPEPYTRTWLYRVVWRTLANKRRTDDRQARLVERIQRMRVPAPVDEEELDEDGLLLEAMRRLRESEQEALRLVAWEELTYNEAAAVLGCSPNAFAVRLHRARSALREAIADVERSRAARERQPIRRPTNDVVAPLAPVRQGSAGR